MNETTTAAVAVSGSVSEYHMLNATAAKPTEPKGV